MQSSISALREKYLKQAKPATEEDTQFIARLPWDQIGLVTAAAVAYFGIRQWAEEHAYIGTVDVQPPPEAFDRDEAICMSFQKMSKFKSIDPKTFTLAVRYMDRILLLEKRLLSKEIQPKFGDIKMVKANMTRVSSCLLSIQCQCKTDANAYCILRREYNYILERMKHHYRVIYNACQYIRQ